MSNRTGVSIIEIYLIYATDWYVVSSSDQHSVGCGQVGDLGSFPLLQGRPQYQLYYFLIKGGLSSKEKKNLNLEVTVNYLPLAINAQHFHITFSTTRR